MGPITFLGSGFYIFVWNYTLFWNPDFFGIICFLHIFSKFEFGFSFSGECRFLLIYNLDSWFGLLFWGLLSILELVNGSGFCVGELQVFMEL